MRSTPEVSSTEVMFSTHGDSVWPMLPPRTFSVGFEEQIVVGVMFFTFTDPKIVVKSSFPILYFKKKNKKPHIFTPPLPSGRGGVKIWGFLLFLIFFIMNIWFITIFRLLSPCRSALIIGIHRIMIHTDQIPQSCGDTCIVCVSRYQMVQFYPFSVSPNIFYTGGRYKLLNQ